MPRVSFTDPDLQSATHATNQLGMPIVISGNFAYVFKMLLTGGRAQAIRCFRQHVGDREVRYQAINKHLDSRALKYAAGFEYDSTGMRVEGRVFPILKMEWINGNTLDVHVDQLLKTPSPRQSLLSLAGEWLRVLDDLRSGGAAHGDIQHGNIMVTSAGLRLVDLDGMFVPALAGRSATEVGHRHFQHPQRTERHFDLSVDNFPALVTYISFLALAEEPSLWGRYHEENLIFTRADFAAPGKSPLFATLRRMNGETGRLSEHLFRACLAPVAATPALTDLVVVKKSNLPIWMTDPYVTTVPTLTQEVPRASVVEAGVGPRIWCPDCCREVRTGAPVCQFCGSALTLRPTRPLPPPTPLPPPLSQPSSPPTPHATPSAPRKTAATAGILGGAITLLGTLICSGFYTAIGLGAGTAAADSLGFRKWFTDNIWPIGVILFGVIAWFVGRSMFSDKSATATLPPTPPPPPPPPPTWHTYPRSPALPVPTPSPSPVAGGPAVVGSNFSTIYHRPSCEWARKVSKRNLIVFQGGSAEAKAFGYRACRVCRPT